MSKKTIYGVVPSKSNCYKIITLAGHGSLAKTKALKQYEKDFYIQCTERDRNIEGYFELHMDVYYPSQRADLDNSLKVVNDMLQKCGVVKNDNQCVHLNIRKFLDKNNPRIEYEVIPIK